MDAALSPPLMPLCLFVAAISHSVPSVCCFVAVCIWLCLCVSSSTSFFHQFLLPVSHFFWLTDHSMLSASHLPMTEYLFCVPVFSQPSCFFVSQFLPVCLGFSQSHSASLSLSLSSSSIQKRISIPTVHSGATPSAPWRDSGLRRTVVCWPPIVHTPAAPAPTLPALQCSWPTWRSR